MPTIIEARSKGDLKRFIELPYSLYAGDAHFVPPLRRDEYRRFDSRHNPFLQHATITPFIAVDGDRVVGRVAAIDDRLHNEVHGERVTWFGFFEAPDAATGRALMATVEAHAARLGSTVVRGPVNPSMHESLGVLVEGFDDDPYALMAYNPPAYATYVEAAGYGKVKDLYSFGLDMTVPLPERIVRIADRVRHRYGITIRPVNLKRFDAELEILKTVYRAAWADNWGFVPPTDAEIRQLAVELKPIVDPELVLFAEMNGEPVGCTVSIPDVHQVLKKMHGNLLPFGVIHFLRRKQIITRARMLLLGVMPNARKLGLYPLLIAEAHARGARNGYRQAEVGWTLEDNTLINTGIEAAGARRTKVHRLYEKPIA
ncbi:MAG: N-acetyltransferase [Acidobacteria bacterium]|nr:N-acetyltransferase [Acidobacteriota bacterium]